MGCSSSKEEFMRMVCETDTRNKGCTENIVLIYYENKQDFDNNNNKYWVLLKNSEDTRSVEEYLLFKNVRNQNSLKAFNDSHKRVFSIMSKLRKENKRSVTFSSNSRNDEYINFIHLKALFDYRTFTEKQHQHNGGTVGSFHQGIQGTDAQGQVVQGTDAQGQGVQGDFCLKQKTYYLKIDKLQESILKFISIIPNEKIQDNGVQYLEIYDDDDKTKPVAYASLHSQYLALDDTLKIITNNFQASYQPGGKPKIRVLGRTRNIIQVGKKQYVMYKGKKISVKEARSLEKKLK